MNGMPENNTPQYPINENQENQEDIVLLFVNAQVKVERIFLFAGKKTMIHRHRYMYEKLYVEFGAVDILLYNGQVSDYAFQGTPKEERIQLLVGEYNCVYPNRVHAVEAKENSAVYIIYFVKLNDRDENVISIGA